MAFHFFADRPVLDFLATIAERGATDEEKLLVADDLACWAAQSGLVSRRPAVTGAQREAAIALREAMYRVLCASIDGTLPEPGDRERINAAARAAPPVPRLTPDGEVLRTGDVEAVLGALARDCLDLVAGPDRALLRRCADERCTRLFVDRSRAGRRRWCDMKGCGDRAKAAAYRERRRAARPARDAGAA